MKFIIDHNAGKLVGRLRMMGFNSVFFTGEDDSLMVKQALAEDRIILTRDTGVMLRRMITSGRVRAVLLKSESPEEQMRQVISVLNLKEEALPFSICLEDNEPLAPVTPEEIKGRVPPYVFKTQTHYMECPRCRRVYWRGTHWLAMLKRLEKLTGITENDSIVEGMGGNTMKVYDLMVKRRSIRRFKNIPIALSALEKCADAARLAPSGRNHQFLDFIVINDAQILPAMFDNIGGSAKLPPEQGGPRPDQTPKAYTIILINKAREGGDAARRRITLYDVGMAAENIILAALEQGIGCCPILMFNEKDIKLFLNIPDDYEIALVIAMGIPDEEPVAEVLKDSTNIYVDDRNVRHVPKRKLADVLHRNGF